MNRIVATAALGLGLVLLLSPIEEASASEHATLTGQISLNGQAAPANVQIIAKSPDQIECGTFTTAEGGTYQLIPSDECGVDASVTFSLAATGEQAPTPVVIAGGGQEVNIAFEGLGPETLQTVGAATPTPPPVVTLPSAPLTGRDLYAVIFLAVIPAMALLLVMVVRASQGPEQGEDENAKENYRSQVEGMVLVMVVVAVILLGVTDKIGSDGLVSVLAAIVGYTIGRQVSDKSGGSGGAAGGAAGAAAGGAAGGAAGAAAGAAAGGAAGAAAGAAAGEDAGEVADGGDAEDAGGAGQDAGGAGEDEGETPNGNAGASFPQA